jgi:hypothetical protein
MKRFIIAEEGENEKNAVDLEPGACWWTDEPIFLVTGSYGDQRARAAVTEISRDTNFKITAYITPIPGGGMTERDIETLDECCDFGVELHQLSRAKTDRASKPVIQKGRIVKVGIFPSPEFPKSFGRVDTRVPYYGD